MLWRDAVRCPHCGSKSEVATGKPPERYRKCLNRRCAKTWRTQEVFLAQAQELQTWYTEMVEARGGGWGPLYHVASEVYDRAVELGLMLGLLKETDYERNEQREPAAGGISSPTPG